MAKVTIYTTMFCPYCHMAKDLLKQKGVAYEEIDVNINDPAFSKRAVEIMLELIAKGEKV